MLVIHWNRNFVDIVKAIISRTDYGCDEIHAVWYIRVGRKSFWVQFLFSVTLSQALMLCSNSDVIH